MKLNRMCASCQCLGTDCAGTAESVWTGCVYRKSTGPENSPYEPVISREVMQERGVLISKFGVVK